MKKKLVLSTMGGLLLGTLALTGCATATPTATATATPADNEQVAVCEKCKTVWVSRGHQINKTFVYDKVKVMECPDCRSAVQNFFTTGKLEHTCTTCGDNLKPCEAH